MHLKCYNTKLIDTIIEIIRQNMDIQINEDQFDEELKSLGINSILYVQMIILLECELDIEFDDKTLDMIEINTINKLYDCIEKQTGCLHLGM